MRSSGGSVSRRDFLGRAALGLAGGLAVLNGRATAQPQPPAAPPARLALETGNSRADNVFQALKRIEPEIRAGLAKKKRVIIKPNMVVVDRQLASTHADCLEGLLEFLGPLVEDDVIVAESPANGPAAEAYDNYDYLRLERDYPVRFVNLDQQPHVIEHVVNERHHARPVRFSKFLLDPDAYLISAAVLKSHDRAVVTLGLKNLAVGAILKDPGYRWGHGSKGVSDKARVHGGSKNQGIHYNLFSLAKRLPPDLTVLDAFEGMEHNGPVGGTPVDHRVALASTDWLAADRVGVELMGFDFAKVGYLTFCADAALGQADLDQIEVLGQPIADHVRHYRPHDNIEQQYQWNQAGGA